VALAVQGCSDADDEAVKHNLSALCACCNSGGGGDNSSIANSVLATHAHPLLLRLQLLLSASAVRAVNRARSTAAQHHAAHNPEQLIARRFGVMRGGRSDRTI
jgi:hypothetical protein